MVHANVKEELSYILEALLCAIAGSRPVLVNLIRPGTLARLQDSLSKGIVNVDGITVQLERCSLKPAREHITGFQCDAEPT